MKNSTPSPTLEALARRRDADRYDAICDHLLVVRKGSAVGPDEIRVNDGELVGTYRLLRQSVAERTGGFYTQDEFDIAPLIARHSGLKFLELGRSCVLEALSHQAGRRTALAGHLELCAAHTIST